MGRTLSNALLSQQQNNRHAENTSLILAYVHIRVTTRALSSLADESGGRVWTHCVCSYVCVNLLTAGQSAAPAAEPSESVFAAAQLGPICDLYCSSSDRKRL